MTDKPHYRPGGPVRSPRPLSIEERLADAEFMIRQLTRNLHNLEVKLQEALDDVAALKRPRDLRYLRGTLRGRS